MFRHRRQLRRWAAQVLLLWLFGIGSGFANACLAAGVAAADEAVATHAHHMHAAPSQDDADHAMPATHHHGGTAHDAAPAKANCQDFCDKSAISIPPLKSALDHAQADALPPPAVAPLCSVKLARPGQAWVPRTDGAAAPPLTLAFLRLAL